MMGSSSSAAQLSALEQVLAIISKPDMLAKNAEAIKKLIGDLENKRKEAAEAQDKASARIAEASKVEASFAPQHEALAKKAEDLQAWENRLHNMNDALNDKASALEEDRTAHTQKVAAHSANVEAFVVREKGFAGKVFAAQSDLDRRKKEIDDHAMRVDQMADENERLKKELKDKLDRIKQLAG